MQIIMPLYVSVIEADSNVGAGADAYTEKK